MRYCEFCENLKEVTDDYAKNGGRACSFRHDPLGY